MPWIKLWRWAIVVLSVLIIMFCVFRSNFINVQDVYTKNKIYTTVDPYYRDLDEGFSEALELNGDTYRLSHVERVVTDRSPVTEESDRTPLIVTSPPFLGDERTHLPKESVNLSGVIYQLTRFTCIPAKYGEKIKEVEKSVHYSNVVLKEGIPLEAEITVMNEATKEQKMVLMPLISYEFSSYQWTDGFEYPVLLGVYDADFYVLGDTLISRCGDGPLKDFEVPFMDYLGLSPIYERVKSVDWVSDVYESDGKQYRKAVVKCQKLVADCDAVYGGIAALDQVDGHAMRSEYVRVTPDYNRYTVQAKAQYVREGNHVWKTVSKYLLILILSGIILLMVLFSFRRINF